MVGLRHAGAQDTQGPKTHGGPRHMGARDTWGPKTCGGLRHMGAQDMLEGGEMHGMGVRRVRGGQDVSKGG